MRKACFLLMFLINIGNGYAQSNPEIDSLENILASQKADSTKVNTLIEIGKLYYENSDTEKALNYGDQAQKLAKKIGFVKGEAYALKLLGFAYAFSANYAEADSKLRESLNLFESINYKEGIANLTDNLGSIYFLIGQDSTAIEYHLKALKIAEDVKNKIRLSTALNNLGTVYANKEATIDKAINYFLRALPIFKEINFLPGIAHASMNLGEIYYKKRMYAPAETHLNAAIEIYTGSPDVCFPLSYLGEIYAEQSHFAEALVFHNRAIEIAETFDAKVELAQSLIALAKTLEKKGDIKLSIDIYKRAQDISRKIGARQEVKKAYEGLSKGFAQLGDFKNAYMYESLLTQIKDTLYNSDESKRTQQLQYYRVVEAQFAIKEKGEQELQLQQQKAFTYVAGITGVFFIVLAGGITVRFYQLRKTKRIIENEKERSENLLLNILPYEVAEELKANGESKARNFDEVTVLFTDFKDFTNLAEQLNPQELVAEINACFKEFDKIITELGVEKIKTIGDAYMAAGGLNSLAKSSTKDVVRAGLKMQAFMLARKEELELKNEPYFEMRVGMHTGPVVAGIVGVKKFQYDIWGDTVNVASRLESSGLVGKVNISQTTFDTIKDDPEFQFEPRGMIEAKNKGILEMYFVENSI